jgi:hypothetical protein
MRPMSNLESQPWQPLSLGEVVERFGATEVDWWIAGGLAIDLFLGWETRDHEDIDIEMFRSDRDVLFDVFHGWDLYTVSAGAATSWTAGQNVDDHVFGIWGRPRPGDEWAVEVILADGDADTWRFRRDPSISLERSKLTEASSDGIRYCTPEVQLLYKGKQHRTKDDLDMVRCLHGMTTAQRQWLANALETSEPNHPWLGLIANSLDNGAN